MFGLSPTDAKIDRTKPVWQKSLDPEHLMICSAGRAFLFGRSGLVYPLAFFLFWFCLLMRQRPLCRHTRK